MKIEDHLSCLKSLPLLRHNLQLILRLRPQGALATRSALLLADMLPQLLQNPLARRYQELAARPVTCPGALYLIKVPNPIPRLSNLRQIHLLVGVLLQQTRCGSLPLADRSLPIKIRLILSLRMRIATKTRMSYLITEMKMMTSFRSRQRLHP